MLLTAMGRPIVDAHGGAPGRAGGDDTPMNSKKSKQARKQRSARN